MVGICFVVGGAVDGVGEWVFDDGQAAVCVGTASCMRAFTGSGWMTNGAHGPVADIRVGR